MDFLDTVSATIRKHSMLPPGEGVLVGLSGGPDSVCLTLVLRKLGVRLHALYVDHGLRPDETPEEIKFCGDLCRGLEIPFKSKAVDVRAYTEERGLNRQEAARELRYRALDDEALEVKADLIALGHTLDDQVETLMMRLLRGAGAKGLSGIPPVRGNIIRPLIQTRREDIMAFLDEEKTGFVIDSSNLNDDYLRNRIRRTLMPALKDINPNIINTLGNAAEVFREEERYLETAVTKAMMRLITRKDGDSIEMFAAPLENMDTVILRRVLRRAVQETRGLRGVGFTHIEDLIGLLREGKPGDRIHLPKDSRAVKKYSTLLLTSAPPPVKLRSRTLQSVGKLVLEESGVVLEASIMEGPAPPGDGKTMAVLDAGKVSFPLTVRAREKGDFFIPAGLGGRKKLQDFFVDEKVPREERDLVPVVASGEDIVWVAGMRADGRFAATGETGSFLVLEVKRAWE
jgi:tRNA(Ile)-lysidine synthase